MELVSDEKTLVVLENPVDNLIFSSMSIQAVEEKSRNGCEIFKYQKIILNGCITCDSLLAKNLELLRSVFPNAKFILVTDQPSVCNVNCDNVEENTITWSQIISE